MGWRRGEEGRGMALGGGRQVAGVVPVPTHTHTPQITHTLQSMHTFHDGFVMPCQSPHLPPS